MLLRLDRLAGFVGHIRRRADSGAGIAGCGLHKEFFDVGQRHDALVQFNVERDAAGEGELASFFENVAEVKINQV